MFTVKFTVIILYIVHMILYMHIDGMVQRQNNSVQQWCIHSGAAMERLSLSSLLALGASAVKEFVQTSAQPHKTRSAHFKAQRKDAIVILCLTLVLKYIKMIQYTF